MPVARDVLFGLYGVFLGASFLLFACVGVECCVEHVHQHLLQHAALLHTPMSCLDSTRRPPPKVFALPATGRETWEVNDQLAMRFVHEYNKNNRKDTKRDEFAWHNKILTNQLRFICLFVNVNGMAKSYEDFQSLKSSANQPNPVLRKDYKYND